VRTSIPAADVAAYISRQLEFFADGRSHAPLAPVIDAALLRFEFCAARIIAPGYQLDGEAYFNHQHGDHSAAFLWFAANTAFRTFEDRHLAERFFLLNKLRNGIVVMYDTELPRVFVLVHTVGTVLGKATYGEFFTAYQGVTVGADRGAQPQIGKRCALLPGARAIGKTVLGDDVTVGPGASIVNATAPAGTIVRGTSPDHTCVPRKRDYAALAFRTLPGDDVELA
jgi:serine O-acetyltransferase